MAGKADIKLGYTCNNHCVHCVIADQRDRAKVMRGSVDRSSGEFLREIEAAREQGLSDVVFTGGEPTLRKDLVMLVAYAKHVGIQRVVLQTNAIRFKDPVYLDALMRAGLDDALVSFHTHDEAISELSRFFKRMDMAHVKKIETAIGEADLLALAAPFENILEGRRQGHDFGFG